MSPTGAQAGRGSFKGRARAAIAAFALSSFASTAFASGAFAQQPAAGEDPLDRLARIVAPAKNFAKAEPYEANQGGGATVRKPVNLSIFSHPSGNMSFERQLEFKVGDGIFRKLWVSSPSSTNSSDGLGPLFNSRSCQGCHLKDGRGAPPTAGETAVSMFLRLSVPPKTAAEREALATHRATVIPDPVYGSQLQNFAVQGHEPEGQMVIGYEEVPVKLADGEIVSLRKPSYSVAELAYGPMAADVMLSPRVTPQMIGVGLLEAIDEKDILAAADPDDKNGDGISGKPNIVWSAEFQKPMLGRLGWKAGEPTVKQQVAHAFLGDIGLSSALSPTPGGECTEAQKACREAPNGDDDDEKVEVTAQMMDLVVFYSRNLGVPARRKVGDKQVLAGKKLFYESGCAACHRPKYVTRDIEGQPEQSGQLIWPYTDLLLHDMGEGLADHRPEGEASGREWRTPPLWGIGLTETVSGHTQFLHDGRARNLLEAILWHGDEAEPAKNRVTRMSKAERAALLAFLNSL
ncbi:MAG: di-heme oxidoredictase family protein [Alphaproteobacteria bacterium]